MSILDNSRVDKEADESPVSKRRKVHHTPSNYNWSEFASALAEFEHHYINNRGKFAFTFVEGPLVKAIREGHW